VDSVLLFRFSALTYNAHRIHYDAAYAAHEGYPGLVVHGPLQALMMGELIRRAGEPLIGQEFAYRLVAPMFGQQRMTVEPNPEETGISVRVRDAAGRVTATSTLRPCST
jgi:3-methylfumaryl-CoA hydratase